MDWDIEIGQELRRAEIHERFGGSDRPGIAPSQVTPNILLFATSAGQQYGYEDSKDEDGLFHYSGEGPVGDQVMSRGNRAVSRHLVDGRALRLFKSDGKKTSRGVVHTYAGEFVIADDIPWYHKDTEDQNGDIRSAIIFRLVPVAGDHSSTRGPEWSHPSGEVSYEPVEKLNSGRYPVDPQGESFEAQRREAELVVRYVGWLSTHRRDARRAVIPLESGARLYTDLIDMQRNELIEAKSSSSRQHVRTALGQLLDYGRKVDHQSMAVLAPQRPSDDLLDLLHRNGIACIYEVGEGVFERSDPESS